jgi:hypothetical protein
MAQQAPRAHRHPRVVHPHPGVGKHGLDKAAACRIATSSPCGASMPTNRTLAALGSTLGSSYR